MGGTWIILEGRANAVEKPSVKDPGFYQKKGCGLVK